MPAWGEYPGPGSAGTTAKQSAISETPLTENSGGIGGTNDGDMPAIATVSAGYVQAEAVAVRDAVREIASKLNDVIANYVGVASITENGGAVGGTNDGNMPTLTNPGGSYVQAQAVATRDGVREVAAKLNDLIADLKAG